ncbi:MAG: hypothetical protein WC058_13670 [Phycisphaeraceae bacterium]
MSGIRRAMWVLASVMVMAGCQSAAVLRQQGMDAYRAKDYATSKAKFGQVADANPADWKAQWYLGKVALAEGDANTARMHLEQAYTLRGHGRAWESETADILDDLTAAILAQGDRARCVSVCDEAIRNFGKARDYMRKGDVLVKLGDADAAVTAYLQAAKIAGATDATPYRKLADMYEQAGVKQQALDMLRVASWIEPRNPEIQEQIRRLGDVPGPTFMRPPAQPAESEAEKGQ